MDYLLIFVIIGGIVLIAVAISYLAERRRSSQLEKVGQELKLNFYPSDPHRQLRRQFALFYLFDKGRNRRISNYIEGERENDVHIAIFDYQYSLGRGRRSKLVKQSVAHLSSEHLHTPVFRLHPEGIWKKLEHTIFQKQDIDFSSHPVFSDAYQLTGPEEEEIREYFNEERLAFFGAHTGWNMEVFPHRILIYKDGVRLKPKDIPAFLRESMEVFDVLSGD